MIFPLFRNSGKKNKLSQIIREAFGFTPRKMVYYEIALTHKSIEPNPDKNNERLEFLGDSILSAVISDYLYFHYPEADEGMMSKMRARIVKREIVNQFARAAQIDKIIKLDHKRGISLSHSPDILGNAFEALIGAIYLEKGFDFIKKILLDRFLSESFDLSSIAEKEENYKGLLLEYAQKNNLELKYETVDHSGTHKTLFTTSVFINDKLMGTAQSDKKKKSEQQASFKALQNLGII